VTHEQETVGHEMTVKVCDYPAFRRDVEVDQNIAAENGVEWAFAEIRFLVQVQPSKVDHLLDFDFHFHLTLSLRDSAQHKTVQQIFR
jgi:hypothetical protein